MKCGIAISASTLFCGLHANTGIEVGYNVPLQRRSEKLSSSRSRSIGDHESSERDTLELSRRLRCRSRPQRPGESRSGHFKRKVRGAYDAAHREETMHLIAHMDERNAHTVVF